MSVTRYDVRKNSENAEAIAIGTEYSRADLLTPAAAAKVKGLLKKYLDQRLLFYGQRASVTGGYRAAPDRTLVCFAARNRGRPATVDGCASYRDERPR